MGEPHHVGSTFGSVSLTGRLPTNLVTHYAGRLYTRFLVKLLSKTKGRINLLPSTPHNTFTVNLLWKVVTLVSCGLSWDNVRTFRKLFTPSLVKDASSLNKMTLTVRDELLSIGTNPYAKHGRLVPDVVHFDHGKDTKSSSCKFRHTCIRDKPMREAILRVDRRGLL